jgi:hypothetical protein
LLLRRELSSQLLDDGGHEERSTSYHRDVLQDLERLTLLPPDGFGNRSWLGRSIRAMQEWQAALVGPDGKLPLLNDAWVGPPLKVSDRPTLTDLSNSGLVVLREASDQAILKVGPIGPAHLPAHTHADALSFTLWDRGSPLVVDPGAFAYSGEMRSAFRSTAVHNTVEVDGVDQCIFWGDFRAAKQPTVLRTPVREQGDIRIVGASHDGYRRLRDPVRHHRSFVWIPGDGMVVIDRLDALESHDIRSSLCLAPDVAVGEDGQLGSFRVSQLGMEERPESRRGWYSPYLGAQEATTVVEDRRTVEPGQLFGWSLLRNGCLITRVEPSSLGLHRRGADVTVPIDV